MILEKTLIIKDVPQKENCQNCKVCLRLRLLEFGLIPGQKIQIKEMHKNLWIVHVVDDNGIPISTLGMRQDEIERILFEEECVISLE